MPRTLAELRQEARGCTACPLWRGATQTVFGEGEPRADVMLVGEQPGDAEDLAGRPFVGLAGQLLLRALGEAGLRREAAYVLRVPSAGRSQAFEALVADLRVAARFLAEESTAREG
jgi:uracil-DNA glycosylase family 4